MTSTEERLKHAGLAGSEAKVYLELLRRGSINGSKLAKKVGIDRTLTYQVLNNLVEKGLVNYIIKEHKKYFSPTDPNNLLQPIKEQEEFIKNLIPDLKNIEKLKEVEQSVEVYEGKAGLKVLFEELLHTREFCFFGATGKSYDILKWEMKRVEKELLKKGIKGRGIVNEQIKKQKWSKLKSLNLRYIQGGESLDTSFGIIKGEKLTIHCLAQDKPLVIIIKNKFIAQTLQNYFEVMWGNLSKEDTLNLKYPVT